MIYPSQTSLIPATVALIRFFEHAGAGAWGMKYPYWYLGTTPFKFLIGPVVPYIVSLVHGLLPHVSLFNITIYFVTLSFILSVLGWAIFTYLISGSKKIAMICGLTLAVMPWRYFSAISFDEASMSVAKNLLPLVLVAFWLYLNKKSVKYFLASSGAFLLLLFVNTSVLPIFMLGVISLALAGAFKDGKLKHLSRHIKRLAIPVIFALILATFWYSPLYWLTILANPSIGGASGIKVLLRVFDLGKAVFPLFLAVFAVYFSRRVKSRFEIFAWTWILTFLFLTVFRFMGDPDFWMDWTAWIGELEIGIAILLGHWLSNTGLKTLALKRMIFCLLLVFLPYFMTFSIWNKLGNPLLLTSNTIPEGVQSLMKVSETAGKERVFLSGSTVFWADALYDIYQVRGGRDQVARDPNWPKAAWEVREGETWQKAYKSLKSLGVSYVLIHTGSSLEYYHDYKNIDKWEDIGEIVWQGNGDILRKIK